MNDYIVHVYNRPTNTYDNIYVLAASNDRARTMVRALSRLAYPMGVYGGQW